LDVLEVHLEELHACPETDGLRMDLMCTDAETTTEDV
jgi:hypothetical protein